MNHAFSFLDDSKLFVLALSVLVFVDLCISQNVTILPIREGMKPGVVEIPVRNCKCWNTLLQILKFVRFEVHMFFYRLRQDVFP